MSDRDNEAGTSTGTLAGPGAGQRTPERPDALRKTSGPERTDGAGTSGSTPAEPAGTLVERRIGDTDRFSADGVNDVDRLSRRMDRAVGGFVDDPRRAVREADAVLDEAAARLTRLLEERRTALRGSWHGDNGERTGTEELRVALTKYRDMTRQLLTSL